MNLNVAYYSYDINSRKTTTYLKDFDHYTQDLFVYSDDYFLFAAYDNQTLKLYTCDMATGKVTAQTGNGVYVELVGNLHSVEKLIVKASNTTIPPALFSLDLKTWKMEHLETVNAEFMSQFEMHSSTRFSFPGWNNENVEGWLHRPVGFDPSKKYPAIVMIHGGPNAEEWDNRFYADS